MVPVAVIVGSCTCHFGPNPRSYVEVVGAVGHGKLVGVARCSTKEHHFVRAVVGEGVSETSKRSIPAYGNIVKRHSNIKQKQSLQLAFWLVERRLLVLQLATDRIGDVLLSVGVLRKARRWLVRLRLSLRHILEHVPFDFILLQLSSHVAPCRRILFI